MGALERAAAAKKIKISLPIAVDAQIDVNFVDGAFFLTARLDISLPGVDRAVGEELIQDAHKLCPYSKAIHGNIAVESNLV